MRNILIVDDEEPVRISIRYLANLEKHGITGIFEASNGREARDILRREKIDILLTDICMPYEDGVSLMDWVHEELPKVRIIVISGYQDFEFAVGAMRSGALDYLLKPIDPEKLNALLSLAAEDDGEKDAENLSVFHQLKEYLDMNYDRNVSLEVLAKTFGFNPSYLSRRFKQLFGTGIIEYSIGLKMRKAEEMLSATDLRVLDIALKLGYKDEKYFSRVFSKEVGCSPAQWRKQKKMLV